MKQLLKTIKSGKYQYIYSEIQKKAAVWTMAGFIEQANRLLEKLWNTGIENPGGNYNDIIGLTYFWMLTGKKPRNVGVGEDFETLELNNTAQLFTNRWALSFVNNTYHKKWDELTGNELMIHGITLVADPHSPTKLAPKEQQLVALKSLGKFINQSDCNSWELYLSLACAIILTSHNGLTEQTKLYLTLFGKLLKEEGECRFDFSIIMPDKHVAPILLTGFLAPILGLTEEKCKDELQEISAALDERINSGITQIYRDLDWKKLLKKIAAKETKDLLFAPATKDDIREAEERLKTKLPKEYKDFLKVSNGLRTFSDSTKPTILRVDQIGWLKDLDKELIDIWCNPDESDDEEFMDAFRKSLLIGGLMEEQQLLLIPSKKSKEWECWFFASWLAGEEKYPNFRYYIESLLVE